MPKEKAKTVYELIIASAGDVGFIRKVKGHRYLDLDSTALPAAADESVASTPAEETENEPAAPPIAPPVSPQGTPDVPLKHTSRVFITHGKNQDIVSQLKELLTFGGFTPVVAIESETVSKPVPDKVLDEMRTCSAAVIHVGGEQKMMDADEAASIDIGYRLRHTADKLPAEANSQGSACTPHRP